MKYTIVSYYTNDDIYRPYAEKLIESLKSLGLEYDVECIDSRGNWNRNTHYKPEFILKMLQKHCPNAIVYTDADSVILSNPVLFENITADVAAHTLEHKRCRGINRPDELLSGTLYFANNDRAIKLIIKWIKLCSEHMSIWDQKLLAQLLTGFYHLPPEYCCIHDTMCGYVKNPVILHFQASREAKKLLRMV
jgi:hypothetical protein